MMLKENQIVSSSMMKQTNSYSSIPEKQKTVTFGSVTTKFYNLSPEEIEWKRSYCHDKTEQNCVNNRICKVTWV